MKRRVPNAGVKDILLPVGILIVIVVVLNVVFGEFGWRSVVALIATVAFLVGFVAIVSWIRASWLRSRGFEPVPLREAKPLTVWAFPKPFRSVRLIAASNAVIFTLTFAFAGLLVGEAWIAAFGAGFGVWAAVVWMASWVVSRHRLLDRGFRW